MSRVLRVLVIPAERYPCDESFLEEVHALNGDVAEIAFLMRSDEAPDGLVTMWHKARVYTFRRRASFLPFAWLNVYFADLRYIFHIWRVARIERPAIIYVRDMTFPLLIAWIARFWTRWRVVYQKTFPHELRWFDPRQRSGYLFPWLFVAARRLEIPLMNWLIGRADAVIPISVTMGDQLVRDGICRRETVHPFGMGVSDAIATAPGPERRRRGDILRLVYIGTLANTRRLEILLEAIGIAHQQHGVSVTLTVVGGTPAEVSVLKTDVARLSLDDRIAIVGRVPRSRIQEVLCEHHAGAIFIPRDDRFWVASVTKLLESVGVGLPCVVTDTVAMHRPLAETTGALVLTDDTAESFAAGIAALEGNWQEYAENALAARSAIYAEHSYEFARQRMSALFTELAKE